MYVFILMTSLLNIFYVDDSIENRKKIDTDYNKNFVSTPALNQGVNFKKYQNKIMNKIKKDINNVNSKEGFQNFNNNTSNTNNTNQLAEQSKQILSETSSGKDNSLQIQYNTILLQYQKN